MGCSSSTNGTKYVDTKAARPYNPDLPSPFDALDETVVALIFSFLLPKSLHNAAQVCQKFNIASFHTSLRTKWELPVTSMLRVNDRVLVRLAGQGIDPVCVDLSGCQMISDEGLKALVKQCSALEELRLGECVLLSPDCIDYVVESCPNLKHVDFSFGRKHRSMDGTLQRLATNSPGLLELNILGWKIASTGLVELSRCAQLQQLTFTCMNSNVDDESIVTLARGCRHLRVFGMSYASNVTQKGYSELLRACRELTELNLKYCQIPMLDEPDHVNESLKIIYFDRVRVSEPSLKSLLTLAPHLEVLKLRNGNHIADSWIPVCLRGCTHLKVLDVFGCPITDKGVDLLIREITSVDVKTAGIKHLNLSHTNITDASVSKLLNRAGSIPCIDVADCPKVRAGTILKFYTNWQRKYGSR